MTMTNDEWGVLEDEDEDEGLRPSFVIRHFGGTAAVCPRAAARRVSGVAES
jgi:hypothetical protein